MLKSDMIRVSKRKGFVILMLAVLVFLAVPAVFLLSFIVHSNMMQPLTTEQERELKMYRGPHDYPDAEVAKKLNDLEHLEFNAQNGMRLKRNLSSSRQWTELVVTQLFLYMIAAGMLWLVYQPIGHNLLLTRVNKLLLVIGIFLIVGGPAVPSIIHHIQQGPSPLPFLGLILFPVGWVMAGVALKPRGSYFRGVLLAVIIYFLIGFSAMAIANIMGVQLTGSEIGDIAKNPVGFVLLSFFWPVFVQV